MKPKIENRVYSYAGNNICNVSATLNIYSDANVIVASTGISAEYNLSQPDFVKEITRQLMEQIMSYLTKLNELDNMRQQLLPTSVGFDDAINMILDPIQTAIGG